MKPATRVRRFQLHRGRRHTPKPPQCPLNKTEIDTLARYNAEVARGLEHAIFWHSRMRDLQRRYDAWVQRCADLLTGGAP